MLGHFALAALAEQRFPAPVVALDGLLAAATLLLVLPTVPGAGGS